MSNLILGSSNADYHANTSYLSSSALKLLLDDPAAFEQQYVLGNKIRVESPAFTEGSLTHALILEPHTVARDYAIYPGLRKQGAEFEAFKNRYEGKTVVSASQMLRCEGLHKAYKALGAATTLLSEGLPEHNMVTSIMGVPIKARADFIKPSCYIVDVKTTSMPSGPEVFKQVIQQYKYHLSAALYCQAALDTYGALHDFYWMVLSKDDRQCHIYKASSDTLSAGSALVTKALALYKKCVASGKWVANQPAPCYDVSDYEILEL